MGKARGRETMTDTVTVRVSKGPYATVRAIEKSQVATPASAGIVDEDSQTYTYEIRTLRRIPDSAV